MLAFFPLLIAAQTVVQVPKAATPPVAPPTEAEACAGLKVYAARLRAHLPLMVDASTRVDNASTDCIERSFTNETTILANLSALHEGWQETKQADWDAKICGNRPFREVAARGWRFVLVFTLLSGERYRLEAHCS